MKNKKWCYDRNQFDEKEKERNPAIVIVASETYEM